MVEEENTKLILYSDDESDIGIHDMSFNMTLLVDNKTVSWCSLNNTLHLQVEIMPSFEENKKPVIEINKNEMTLYIDPT